MAVVNKLSDLSPQALQELEQFLEPYWHAKTKGLAGAAAAGTEDPNAIHFNSLNTILPTRYVYWTSNVPNTDGYGTSIRDSGGGINLASDDPIIIESGDTGQSTEITSRYGVVVLGGSGTSIAWDGLPGHGIQVLWEQPDAKLIVQSSPKLPITAVNTGLKRFTVAGDYTLVFRAGLTAFVSGSTGNDGIYTITSSTLSAGNTLVIVTTTPPSAVADGVLFPNSPSIFEVRADGTVHISTGATVQSDL